MKKLLSTYFAKEDGATAIEYGLIIAAIGLAIVITVGLIGTDLIGVFTNIRTFL